MIEEKKLMKKLSENDLEHVAGGAASGRFMVDCDDCDFCAFFDASSYDAALAAAAAHEQATGHIALIAWKG